MFHCQDQNPSNTLSIHLSNPPSTTHPFTHLYLPTSIIIYLYVPRRVYIFERSTQTFQSFHSKIVFLFSSQIPRAPRVVLVLDPGDGAGAVDLHAPRAGAGSRGVAALLQPHHLGGRGYGGVFGDWEDRPGHIDMKMNVNMNIVKYIYIYIYICYTYIYTDM